MKPFATVALTLLSGPLLAADLTASAPVPPADPAWGAPLPWSRYAAVETLPGMQAIRLLNDGDPATAGLWCTGTEAGGEVAVRFPGAVEVTGVRFVQLGGVTKWRLAADLEGQGTFDTVIREQADPKPIVKEYVAVPVNRKVRGLKWVALEGAAGYRAPYPSLAEFEIYSKEVPPPAPAPARADAALVPGAPKPLPAFTRREIDIRLCIDTWHAGIVGRQPGGNLETNKGFQAMLQRFKEADANSARLFTETGCGSDEMPWKSEVLWPGHGTDQLGPLARALHANGIKLVFFTHAWMSPFQKRGQRAPMPYARWDYPYEQSDRLVGVDDHYSNAYPCVISDRDFRDKWLAMLDEAIRQGADGVYGMPDEYYFKGHNLSRVDCKGCAAGFKAMYGFDALPTGGGFTVSKTGATTVINRGRIEDTEQYRKWKLFEYRRIADLFHGVSAELKKRHPQAQIMMSDNKITEDLGGRLEHNMCLDLIENDPNADLAQVYGNAVLDRVGWISAYARRIGAAAGNDKLLASIQWLNVQGVKTNYPIQLFGYAMPQIMLGARAYENYRLNYMYDTGWWTNAIECHRMIRLLEQWGVRDSATPDVACLLLSRASEDWWRTKLESQCGVADGADVSFNLLYAGDDINKVMPKAAGSERDRVLKLDALRGVGSKLAMESLLCESAIPYQVAFADRADHLENLKRFRVIIMPFAYALSKPAFGKIREAVEAGTKLVVFGPLAPADEFGNPHPEPLLQALKGHPNVVLLPDNLAAVGNSAVKRAEYRKLLDPMLAPAGYAFEAGGQPVECIVRTLPKGGYLVYLGNWSASQPARPILSLPPLKGAPRAEVYSSATRSLADASVGSWSGLAVDLAPAEVKLVRFY